MPSRLGKCRVRHGKQLHHSKSRVKLADFGLAKGKPLQMTRVTTTGSIYGYTPNYAPLEQIRGLGTDPRSDLYALGATLYHLLTGTPPIDAATRADSLLGREGDPLPPASEANPGVPEEISMVLAKAMEPHRNDRPSSAREMLSMLNEARRSTSGRRAKDEKTTILNEKLKEEQRKAAEAERLKQAEEQRNREEDERRKLEAERKAAEERRQKQPVRLQQPPRLDEKPRQIVDPMQRKRRDDQIERACLIRHLLKINFGEIRLGNLA